MVRRPERDAHDDKQNLSLARLGKALASIDVTLLAFRELQQVCHHLQVVFADGRLLPDWVEPWRLDDRLSGGVEHRAPIKQEGPAVYQSVKLPQ